MIDSLTKAIERHPVNNEEKVDLLNQLGYRYWIVDPFQSILFGKRGLALASKLEYEEGVAFANRVIGVAYWVRGDFDDASEHLFQSISNYQQIGDKLGEANSLMNLGLVFAALERHNRALEYYAEAYEIFESLEEEGRIGTTYTKIATVYLAKSKLDSAELFLKEAERIHEKNNYIYGMSEVHNRNGLLLFQRGDLENAVKRFQQSIGISEEINDQEGLTKNYADLSKVFIAQGKLEEAEKLLKLGTELAKKIGFNRWLKEMFLELRQVYEMNGDLEKSLYYYDLYVELKDSLIDQQQISNLITFETQIATIAQQTELNEAKRALQINRLILGLIVAILIIIVLIAYTLLIKARNKTKVREAETKKLSQELEYKNKELTSYALNLAQKNQLFLEIGEEIKSVKDYGTKETKTKINSLEKFLNKQHQVDRDWEDFRLRFESIHEGFFDMLLKQNPSLTNYELRLCALVRLNFSMKEIGNILGISADSVKTARYRLKKKLQLSQEETLNEYLQKLTLK